MQIGPSGQRKTPDAWLARHAQHPAAHDDRETPTRSLSPASFVSLFKDTQLAAPGGLEVGEGGV